MLLVRLFEEPVDLTLATTISLEPYVLGSHVSVVALTSQIGTKLKIVLTADLVGQRGDAVASMAIMHPSGSMNS